MAQFGLPVAPSGATDGPLRIRSAGRGPVLASLVGPGTGADRTECPVGFRGGPV